MIFTSATYAAAWRQEEHREVCRNLAKEASQDLLKSLFTTFTSASPPAAWRQEEHREVCRHWLAGPGSRQGEKLLLYSERAIGEILNFSHWRSSSTLNPLPPPAPVPLPPSPSSQAPPPLQIKCSLNADLKQLLTAYLLIKWFTKQCVYNGPGGLRHSLLQQSSNLQHLSNLALRKTL